MNASVQLMQPIAERSNIVCHCKIDAHVTAEGAGGFVSLMSDRPARWWAIICRQHACALYHLSQFGRSNISSEIEKYPPIKKKRLDNSIVSE
eukprot:scaffold153691_cov51-Prasinocladus_malaysianus.AAC.1